MFQPQEDGIGGPGLQPGLLGQLQTVHPPGRITQQNNLNDQSSTGVGAVWDRYYAMLPNKNKVIAYISLVADQSGGNDLCQASDTSVSLTSATMDSWSATRWITRIANQNGMMATALAQARSCGFTVFYWAHDVHLWDGTIPFTTYASCITPAGTATAPANLALTGTVTASTTVSGFPASNTNDGNQNTYWQATGSTATLTLYLAQAAPIGRIVLELPQAWGARSQTIEVDASTNGSTWTTLAPSATYQFTAGSNTVTLSCPAATESYLRLDISGNTVQGAPQVAEFQAYSS
jgi:hypothetical protein